MPGTAEKKKSSKKHKTSRVTTHQTEQSEDIRLSSRPESAVQREPRAHGNCSELDKKEFRSSQKHEAVESEDRVKEKKKDRKDRKEKRKR